MTLLLFLKPTHHQGASLPAEEGSDTLPKRKRKPKRKQIDTSVIERTLNLAHEEVAALISRVVEEERAYEAQQLSAMLAAQELKAQQERLLREEIEHALRLSMEAEIVRQQQEAVRQQVEAEQRARAFMAFVADLARKELIRKRKKLNMIIAAAIDWF